MSAGRGGLHFLPGFAACMQPEQVEAAKIQGENAVCPAWMHFSFVGNYSWVNHHWQSVDKQQLEKACSYWVQHPVSFNYVAKVFGLRTSTLYNALKKKIDDHDKLLDNDNKRLKEIEDSNRMILQCLLVIINHDITGNGIEKMKTARDELQEFLINK